MPHIHLPTDHTDADLVLAANVAEVVGSEDLYVAWSHECGPGAVPEVEAILCEPPARGGALAELIATMRAGFAAFWQVLMQRPEPALPSPAGPPAARAGEASAS
jgi:hypothetical protein